MNERMIIVETGQFTDERTGVLIAPSYQLFERLSNGTWRLAKNLSDGQDNPPMYFRDARRRLADMSRVKAYGSRDEEEEE